MDVYIPEPGKFIHETSVDFATRVISRPVHLTQHDAGLPILAVKLYFNKTPLVLVNTATVNIRFYKTQDETFIYNPALGCNAEQNVVYFEITEQMTVYKGLFRAVVELKIGDDLAGSSFIEIEIDRNPIKNSAILSSNEFIVMHEFADKAETAAGEAENSAIAAAASEQNAALSADLAETSETNAYTSAQNSASSSNAANTSKNAAKLSETNAKTSETNAKTSETNAADYASAAHASKLAAKTSEDNAKASETKAKTSETNAAASETNAAVSATFAAGKAQDASDSASAAQQSEDTVAQHAQAAATSEQNAKTSETNAKTSETNAKTSETTAANHAIDALNNILNGIDTHDVSGVSHEDIRAIIRDVEAIARGKATSYTFDTLQQLNDWLAGTYVRADGKVKADLINGDNLYIRDINVKDYWWDAEANDISELEAEAPDLADYYLKEQVDAKLPIDITRTEYDILVANGTLEAGRKYDIEEGV